jgi:hypothetical protein
MLLGADEIFSPCAGLSERIVGRFFEIHQYVNRSTTYWDIGILLIHVGQLLLPIALSTKTKRGSRALS